LRSNRFQPTVPWSDEVREALRVGPQKVPFLKVEISPETSLVYNLLIKARPYSWIDGFARLLKSSPRRLNVMLVQCISETLVESKSLAAGDKASSSSESGNLSESERKGSILSRAEGVAHAEGASWVESHHVLRAALESSDPALVHFFQRLELTPSRFMEMESRLKTDKTSRAAKGILRELIEFVVLVLFFLILTREWVGEPRLIPSESMLPTLQVEDRVFIEKLTHWWRPHQRGDILVFYPPTTTLRQDPWSWFLRASGFSGLLYKKEDNIDLAYIKRLIALPGDWVEVRPQDGVFINGKRLIEPYTLEVAQSCTQQMPFIFCGPVKVPPNHYFMMGDNRNGSQDSRFWGFLPKERVVGRAVSVLWPLPRLQFIQNPLLPKPASAPPRLPSTVGYSKP
jgi:signal peptidase I